MLNFGLHYGSPWQIGETIGHRRIHTPKIHSPASLEAEFVDHQPFDSTRHMIDGWLDPVGEQRH